MKNILLITLLAFFSFNAESADLFWGERMVHAGGFPALTYYQRGHVGKPLVVFIPGMMHLARMSYGIPGTKPTDFLAYWLHQKGYSFLGISYPLENAVYHKTYPEFTIQDWAVQTCEIIHDRHPKQSVIILAWSMAGALARDLALECKKRDLDIQMFIGLAAAAPNPYTMNKALVDSMKPNNHGLVKLEDVYLKWFEDNLDQENNKNHHIIIAPSFYRKNYLGPIPVNINASGKRYKNGKFIEDPDATIRDAGSFDFVNYPWIALIFDDSRLDTKISSVDPYSWYQIIANRYYWKFVEPRIDILSQKQIDRLQGIIHAQPVTLTRIIHGSHFFFVGEQGAKQTVELMEEFLNQMNRVKT